MSIWQPIETAPTDGTPIDIWVEGFPDRRVVNMKWDVHEWGFRNYADPEQGWMEDELATHWMPLPEPPTAAEQGTTPSAPNPVDEAHQMTSENGGEA